MATVADLLAKDEIREVLARLARGTETSRYALLAYTFLALGVGMSPLVSFAGGGIPSVAADVSLVSSGPSAGDGHFRLIISVSEIYESVFIEWVSLGEEGSSVKVAGQYAVKAEDLGGHDHSVTAISDIRWIDYRTVKFAVNDKGKCTLTLGTSRYDAVCE